MHPVSFEMYIFKIALHINENARFAFLVLSIKQESYPATMRYFHYFWLCLQHILFRSFVNIFVNKRGSSNKFLQWSYISKTVIKTEFHYPLHVAMGVAYSCLKY